MIYCLLYPLLVIISLLVALKLDLRLTTRWNNSPTCLIGKTAMVTGANRGIGYYTALDFAKRGARVILVCRDKESAEVAKNRIITETGNSNVIIGIVDFASLSSVRCFAKHIRETEDRLDILVNNAGVAICEDVRSEDGLNLLMQINYFSPALLTILLINLLKNSKPSRVVNLTSAMARRAKLIPHNLNDYLPEFQNYNKSKLCNVFFTNELAKRLKNTGVVVNSLHPGAVRTDILRNVPFVKKALFNIILFFGLNAEEGAQTSIYVSVSKDIEGVTGEYFANCDIPRWLTMPEMVRDEGLLKKVWEKTEELLKLTKEERQMLYN